MQRRGVSCAVRLTYTSLGAKGLIFCPQKAFTSANIFSEDAICSIFVLGMWWDIFLYVGIMFWDVRDMNLPRNGLTKLFRL